jgi:two-component system, sensor histidine kinase
MIIAKIITHFIKNEQLKLQNHFLEMLTATISHDMRTPLNAILGMGKNLEKRLQDYIGKKIHRVIMNSAYLLHFLVNDILDLMRLKNNKFQKIDVKTNIRTEFTDLLEIFSLQTEEKGLKI